MGVDSLFKFLTKRKLVSSTHINDFRGKKVAFDAAIFMHVFFYRGLGTLDDVKMQWDDHTDNCKAYGIVPIIVFDGKKLKAKEKEYKKRGCAEKRKRELFDEHQSKVDKMIEELNETTSFVGGLALPKPTSAEKPIAIEDMFDSAVIFSEPIKKTTLSDVAHESASLMKRKKQCEHIPSHFYDEIKSMLIKNGIETVSAQDEAERECVVLCKNKTVDVVATNDSDSLVFGAGADINLTLVTNWNTQKMSMYYLPDILKSLCLTNTQFIDFCLLCGTDFSDKVAGTGPALALKQITEHGTIDHLNALFPNAIYDEMMGDARSIFKHEITPEMYI
jgi:5'-3' exonuclease